MPINDASDNPTNPFQLGSDHLRPTKAVDPGLVYDASYADYLLFLCSTGVPNLDPSFKCLNVSMEARNLNYPSLAISDLNGTITVKRTVTNVGDGNSKSVYFAQVRPPSEFSIKVSPHVLSFTRIGEKKSFTITVKAKGDTLSPIGKTEYKFGLLTWNDEVTTSRVPLQCR
ncbi:hypothetical protein U1Q18_009437 [Sarracenia purpurea var. burkii]